MKIPSGFNSSLANHIENYHWRAKGEMALVEPLKNQVKREKFRFLNEVLV